MAQAISDCFTIDYVNQKIYNNQTYTDIFTVNALYSYLQETFDELDQMDDAVPMSAQTPTEYTLINGWYVDDDSFKYLKGGAVKTSGWTHPANTTGIRILTLGGLSGVTSGDIGTAVAGVTTGDTGKLLAFNATDNKLWVRVDAAGDTFASSTENITVDAVSAGNMTAVGATGENLWANIYTLGSIEQHINEEQIYIAQAGARIFSGSEWWPEDKVNSAVRHVDVLVKVKEADVPIGSGNITVFLRNYPSGGDADLYDNFGLDLSNGGRNAVPLATSVDLNNTSTQAVASGYNSVTVAFINGTVSYNAISGSFTNLETVTWTGGTGIFLKQTTTTSAGVMTLGNVEGANPTSGLTITGVSSSATAGAGVNMTEAYRMVKQFEQQTVSPEYSVIIGCATRPLSEVYEYLKYVSRIGSTFSMFPTASATGAIITHSAQVGQLYIRAHEDNQSTTTNVYSPVKASPFGTFAGGKFFGAQGVWVENMAGTDIQNFQLIDADQVTRTPPNKQSITITSLSSDDRVTVFRTTGAGSTTIDKAMYSAGAGNVTSNTTFVVTGSIAVDTPSAGTIRIVDNSDTSDTRETRYIYTSWSASTFSGLTPGLNRQYTQTDDEAYVPFIDLISTTTSSSVQVIYTADRPILVRVRRKTAPAILPFEAPPGTFGSTGYSTSAIRTTDSIVT